MIGSAPVGPGIAAQEHHVARRSGADPSSPRPAGRRRCDPRRRRRSSSRPTIVWSGRDSIRHRFTPRLANCSRISSSAPGWFSRMNNTIVVLSAPVAGGTSPGRDTSTKRVTASGLSAICSASGGQPVRLAGDLGADRGIEPGQRIGDLGRRGGGGSALGDHHLRQMAGQPVAALGGGVRVGQDVAYVVQASPRSGEQGELDRQHHLAGDHQRLAVGQRVQRGGDSALDRVLDRDQRRGDLPVADGLQGQAHSRVRDRLSSDCRAGSAGPGG